MEERQKLTEKPGYYAIIPANVRYDKTLSPNAKLLYGEITCMLSFNAKCFASNAYFSRLYELSEVQISRLINQLVKGNYIKITIESKSTGTVRYIGLPLNIFDGGGLNKNDKRGLNKNDKHNKHSININTISEDIVNVLFVQFWNLYDKKVGLKEAFKSWNKLSVETHKLIIQKIPAWKLQNEFLPHPSTFLNQERWMDEIIKIITPADKKLLSADPLPSYYKKIQPSQFTNN